MRSNLTAMLSILLCSVVAAQQTKPDVAKVTVDPSKT